MKIQFRRTLAAAVVAGLALGAAQAAYAEPAKETVDASTNGLVATGGDLDTTNPNGASTVADLVCAPGKVSYKIAYRGELDMRPVVAKWNEKKEAGRGPGSVGAAVLGTTYDELFNDLNVTGENFKFEFTIDPTVVTVDEAKIVDVAAWKAAYEAENPEFSQHMVIDEAKAPTYANGKVTVFFKLKDGLKAGALDRTFNAPGFEKLTITSLADALSVSAENYKAAVQANKASFDMIEAKVSGTFLKPTSDHPRAGAMINQFMEAHFPIDFGQAAPAPAVINLASPYTIAFSYDAAKAPKGEAAPANLVNQVNDDAVKNPEPVKTAEGTWTFDGWKDAAEIAWNDDPNASPNCRVKSKVGSWSFTPAKDDKPNKPVFPWWPPFTPETPDTTPTPQPEPQPKPEVKPEAKPEVVETPKAAGKVVGKATLAKTGADAAGVAGLAALFAAVGAVALRRKNG